MPRKKGSKSKPKVSQVKTDSVKITLKSLGRVFTSEGNTFEEAIDKIKISGGARALSIISVEKDGVKKDRILNARQTNGLFGQGSFSMKEIHLKNVRELLGV